MARRDYFLSSLGTLIFGDAEEVSFSVPAIFNSENSREEVPRELSPRESYVFLNNRFFRFLKDERARAFLPEEDLSGIAYFLFFRGRCCSR